MSDSYYELVDATDELGEKFVATDLARRSGRPRFSMLHPCRPYWCAGWNGVSGATTPG
jgi:hypothetical protein